jgi:hypothetical protein
VKRWIIVAAVLLAVGLASAVLLGMAPADRSGRSVEDPRAPVIRAIEESDLERRGGAIAGAGSPRNHELRRGTVRDRARADEIRRALAALARAERADPGEPSKAPDSAEASAQPQVGNLANRDGFSEEIMAAFNSDFMPLIDECMQMARERNPTPQGLQGMLALEVNAAGDPDLGSVIEGVEFPADNEILDRDLLECVRETAMSLTLPPPKAGGRHAMKVTIPMGDE